MRNFLCKIIKTEIITRLLLMLVTLSFVIGCISESNFRLSDESRLPKWFVLPDGAKREDVTVRLYYYVYPDGREAKLVFKINDRFFSTQKVKVKLRGFEPLMLEKDAGNDYPSYEILIDNKVVDIVEHKGRNDVFYMTDDSGVWKELGVEQK